MLMCGCRIDLLFMYYHMRSRRTLALGAARWMKDSVKGGHRSARGKGGLGLGIFGFLAELFADFIYQANDFGI